VQQKSGRVFSSWALSVEYGFSDVDGRRPHFGRYAEETFGVKFKTCDDGFYEYWFGGVGDILFSDWP
jgi:hypothetical protein